MVGVTAIVVDDLFQSVFFFALTCIRVWVIVILYLSLCLLFTTRSVLKSLSLKKNDRIHLYNTVILNLYVENKEQLFNSFRSMIGFTLILNGFVEVLHIEL